MRKLLSLLILSVALTLGACSSSGVNDLKLDLADKVKVGAEKSLNKAYEGISIPGHSCSAEAEMQALKLRSKVVSFLKAEEKKKSALGDLAPVICSVVIQQGVPALLEDPDSDSACLRQFSSDGVKNIGQKICDSIDL